MYRRTLLQGAAGAAAVMGLPGCATAPGSTQADLILRGGRIHTLDARNRVVSSAAVRDGKILAVGSEAETAAFQGPGTTLVELAGRVVIPGLNDSHIHLINGGLQYNLEVRWDEVESLADALRLLREQVQRTPPGQWVRVLGGWSEFQFAEKRMPTIAEINAVSSDVPVMLLHFYDTALLNKARSAAKNAPPASASRAARPLTGRERRWVRRQGMRTSAAIDTR